MTQISEKVFISSPQAAAVLDAAAQLVAEIRAKRDALHCPANQKLIDDTNRLESALKAVEW